MDFVHRLGVKECWASPKGISLSAESDKGVALDLRAFEKARAKLLTVLEKFISYKKALYNIIFSDIMDMIDFF